MYQRRQEDTHAVAMRTMSATVTATTKRITNDSMTTRSIDSCEHKEIHKSIKKLMKFL